MEKHGRIIAYKWNEERAGMFSGVFDDGEPPPTFEDKATNELSSREMCRYVEDGPWEPKPPKKKPKKRKRGGKF